MSKAEKNQQIKQITQELLERLSNGPATGSTEFELQDDQQSRHESDTSSLADEKEIHNKLTQIMNLIAEDGNRESEEEDIVRSEEEFSRRMADEVFDSVSDAGSEDLDLYQIQADELADDELDFEAEMQKLAIQFFPNNESEEEKVEDDEETKAFNERAVQVQELALQFNISNLKDDHKCEKAGYYGGFTCTDAALQKRLRSAATEIIKMVGKKIFTGQTDLTRISFPIKCMAPISALEIMPTLQSTMAVYMNKAASISDPVERMKFVMAHNLSFFYKEKIFEKPLNPILGETFQARGQDGSYIYMEQTSHHPPISHFYIEGPNGNYKLTGWSQHGIKVGVNSCNLHADGHKEITFKDGHKIRYNNTGDYIFNLMMGSMGHQLTGKMTFTDAANNIEGVYEPGKYRMKTQDYVCGQINVAGKKVSEIYANYMGFADFDKQRYWDIREMDQVWFPIVQLDQSKTLMSDSKKRLDSITLRTGDVAAAQAVKERLEDL